jgi:chemotaxis protein CheD
VLHPGDVACAERGDRLETLLGSCVAVVLTDRHRTVAAMCHVVHCRSSTRDGATATSSADGAVDRMYALLFARGLNARLCEAFVYGGGNMFPGLYREAHVGDSNACCVLERLTLDGVRVSIRDLGGSAYRRVCWTIGTGLPEVIAVDVKECE